MPEPTKAIISAAKKGQVDLVRSLLALNPVVVNARDADAPDLTGQPPIHHTTFHKANAVAKLLEKCAAG